MLPEGKSKDLTSELLFFRPGQGNILLKSMITGATLKMGFHLGKDRLPTTPPSLLPPQPPTISSSHLSVIASCCTWPGNYSQAVVCMWTAVVSSPVSPLMYRGSALNYPSEQRLLLLKHVIHTQLEHSEAGKSSKTGKKHSSVQLHNGSHHVGLIYYFGVKGL